ncbi:hypothetical protein TNCV_549981 [Trichonephila clavipes]|nr:hypothetical protein TNCV_549981 [Trichonephila clavipes]
MVRKELNLGLRRPFIWTFIIADVSSPIIALTILTVDANISFKNILPEYPDLSNPSLISKSGSHGTVHHIITTGPPVTARPREGYTLNCKKDSKPLNWSSEAITAFQRCKQALADAALVAHPSPSAPLALHVDASLIMPYRSALHQVVDS